LFLQVLAFWFVLRWLLVGRALLLISRALVLMMIVGLLAAMDQHHVVWAACFAGAALMAWALLRRWRGQGFPGTNVTSPGTARTAWLRRC